MIGYMGEDAPSDVLATAYDIWTGAYARKLNEDRDAALTMDKQVAALRDSWNALPEGQAKANIWGKYQQANASVVNFKVNLNQAIGKYNSVADAAAKYSAGMVSVPRVGMAIVQVGAAAIVLAAVALLGGWAILRELRVWYQGSGVAQAEAKGYIDQTTDAIKAVGGVVHETGTTAIKIAVAVGIVAVIYLGYRWMRGRRSGGGGGGSVMRALAAPSSAPTLDLKPVTGTVVA